jgi:Zn-dependent metalloprotease
MTGPCARIVASCLGLLAVALVAKPPVVGSDEAASDARLTTEVRAHRELGRGLDGRHTLKVRQVEAMGGGASSVRSQQYFQGVRVLGGELILRQSPGRSPEAVADALVRDLHIASDPSLEVREALAIAHVAVAPKAVYRVEPTAELVVFPVMRLVPKAGVRNPENAEDFDEVVLRHEPAYLVHVELEQGEDIRHEDLLVQAHSGGILRHWSTLHTTAHEGRGKSQHSGSVKLSTNAFNGGFELRDLGRAGNHTTNMNGGTSGNGSVYASALDEWGDGLNYSAASGSTSANGQTAAVDAHYGMQVTWDFLSKVMGRNGIDGTGRTVFSRVHYSTSYDNAFWSDACFCMTFGDGSMFKTLTAMDVAAHEMGHGVCATTANLAYVGESGGLNEANSDIIGTMVEFYALGAQGQGTVIPDTGGNWTIGEQLATANFPTPLRYLQKPSLDGRSPDAWSATLGSLDVHFSSGPMNRAFYFLSQGSSASASNAAYSSYLPAGMSGLGNDKAMRIWWRTLTTRLTSSSNYLAARTGAIAAAKELYGAGSAEEKAVWNAFAGINVGTAWKVIDTTAPTVTAAVSGSSGTVVFTATATDNLGVTKVEYYVNGALKGSATASPYTFGFVSTALVNGSYSLVAKAYDAAGNVGTSAAVAFTINNADRTAPAVTAKVAGTGTTRTFTATATDNVGVSRVEYFVDGASKGSATVSPYTVSIASATVANGSHSLLAKAYDAAGNIGVSAIVTFVVDTVAPSVIPAVLGTRGTLALSANATDNIGVTKVEYYVDGALKGSAVTSPYAFGLVSTALANGSHSLVAKAYDAAGNMGASATVSFTVDNDKTAPTVTAAVSGSSGTLAFRATATDNLGVTKVEYYVNNALKGSATASPYAFDFVSTALANGTYSLVAKAYDAAGNIGTSAAVAFSINNADKTAPTVAAGIAGTGTTRTFTAAATDNVGVSRVEYFVDGASKGSATVSPYSVAFDGRTVPNGSHSLVAKAYDAAGNVGVSAAVAFVVDTAAPSVVAAVAGTSGTLAFSATATDNLGVTRVEYYINGVLKGTATVSPYPFGFVSTALANGSYSLSAKAYDASGNVGTSAAVPFTINNPDTKAPTVTAAVAGSGSSRTFTATATDNLGVSRVEYFVDGASKGSAMVSPYPVAFDCSSQSSGSHSLVAKAYDAAGNVGTSAAVAFTVSNPTATTLQETESNDTTATANAIGATITKVSGTLSTGRDVDTFALTLVAGQSVLLTLTPPPGTIYGLTVFQGLQAQKALAVSGATVIRIPPPPPAAMEVKVYIQIYSCNGQGSTSPYGLSIQR